MGVHDVVMGDTASECVQCCSDRVPMHKHGSLGGHVLPGSFFIIWGSWWFINVAGIYIHRTQHRKGHKAFSYFSLPFWPSLRLEPALKILLPFIGVLGELYFSHKAHWRDLYTADGRFWSDHLNNWQHSMMFLSFMASGAVDLVGSRFELPPGVEHAFLALAFVIEGILFAFHLKGPPLEWDVHFLLVLLVFACALAVLLELAQPASALASLFRAYTVIVQGTWFCQVGRILYLGNPAWDTAYMGSAMFVPVVFCCHVLFVGLAMLLAYCVLAFHLGTKAAAQRGFQLIELANEGQEARHSVLIASRPTPS